jgi:uncharacterized protein involved in exopolysaccharide biosynthesis
VLKMTSGAREFAAPESFDAYQYLAYLRRRSRFLLIVCASAALAALAISLLLPKQYTATASVIIDPPAGNDPRNSVGVSPVYLESLRAYEMLASGDTLFARAAETFQLRDAGTPLESLKRRILKVTKVRDTKILEIEVTLPDPRRAQALAQFIAEQTVALSRNSNLENDQDLTVEAERNLGEAQKRLEQEQAVWRDFSVRQPYEAMRAEMESLTASRERLQHDLLDSRAELAEISKLASDERVNGLRARLESLEKQDRDLAAQIQSRAGALSDREARAAQLEQRLRAAQTTFDSASARLREIQAAKGLRGERLRVMDPGVAPERPSSPNVFLNVLLALAVSLIASLVYLTLRFRPSLG